MDQQSGLRQRTMKRMGILLGWLALSAGAAAAAQAQQSFVEGVPERQFPASPGPALPHAAARAAAPVDFAPAPSDRFPAAWYPPENDWTTVPAPVKRLPYSATLVETTVLPAPGSRKPMTSASRSRQYRDREGRTRTEQTSVWRGGPAHATGEVDGRVRLLTAPQDVPRREIEVIDPVAHCTFRWAEPWTGIGEPTATVRCLSRRVQYGASVFGWLEALTSAQRSSVRFDGVANWGYQPLGARDFHGIRALGVRQMKTLAGREVDFWWSPGLHELIAMGPSTPVFGFPFYELTEVKLEDPAPSLFYPPSNYRIVNEAAAAAETKASAQLRPW
jgi:hypothetical protein